MTISNHNMKSEGILQALFSKLAQFSESHKEQPGKRNAKSSEAIMKNLDKFTKMLEDRCTTVAKQVPKLAIEMETALSDALDTKRLFRDAIENFTSDPFTESNVDKINRTGSALLSSISRILILAEVADSYGIVLLADEAESALSRVYSAVSSKELSEEWIILREKINRILDHLIENASDLSNRGYRDYADRAQYVLSNNGQLLFNACKVYLHHPDLAATQSTKQFAYKTLADALGLVRSMLNEENGQDRIRLPVCGTLLRELEAFENAVVTDFNETDKSTYRTRLKNMWKRFSPLVLQTLDSPRTQSGDRDSVSSLCDAVDQCVISLVDEIDHQPPDRSALNSASKRLLDETGKLKQALVRLVISRAIQATMTHTHPLMSLSDATKFGNQTRMDDALESFQEHSTAMVAAGYQVCSLTSNQRAAEQAQLACVQLEQLCPQVISAAYLLFKHPQSRTVEANFGAFRKAHEDAAELLYSSICDLVALPDVLSIVDEETKEDLERTLQALANKREDVFHEVSSKMQYRARYLCDLVARKLSSESEDTSFAEATVEKVKLIRNEFLPTFTEISRDVFSYLAAHHPVDHHRYRIAASNLYTAIHGLRSALLWNRPPSPVTFADYESPDESNGVLRSAREAVDEEEPSQSTETPQPPVTNGSTGRGENRPAVYSLLSSVEKADMSKQVASFVEEKKQLMSQVAQCDESGNEIINLAKRMSVIMMDLANFVYEQGSLKSVSDVIKACKQISDLGDLLCEKGRRIASMCPESSNRQDLLFYLDRVTLYSHQLRITGRVKAGQEGTLGPAVSVENAFTLIQTARNLMRSVVSTVKESYIASTKYLSPREQSIVGWRVRVPEMQPITPQGVEQTKERRLSRKHRHLTELEALSEFERKENNFE